MALWALTDHDEIGGQARAAAAAAACGLDYLTGVEISVTFLQQTVHIVGLGFDVNNAALAEGLQQTRGGRSQRAREMAADLARVGIQGAFEGALKYAGNPDLISRTHFRPFFGGNRRLQRHLRGVSQIPHRRQARLCRAPLGQPERRGALDHPGGWHGGDCAPGALQIQRQ